MPTQLYRVNWSHNSATDKLIKHWCKGSVLNLCSGKSQIGFRVDIDPTVKPDMLGDIYNLPFPKLSFDTVIMDPPWSYYSHFKWLLPIGDLARKRLILSTPCLVPWFGTFKLRHILSTIQPGSLFFRIWLVFDRTQALLT